MTRIRNDRAMNEVYLGLPEALNASDVSLDEAILEHRRGVAEQLDPVAAVGDRAPEDLGRRALESETDVAGKYRAADDARRLTRADADPLLLAFEIKSGVEAPERARS